MLNKSCINILFLIIICVFFCGCDATNAPSPSAASETNTPQIASTSSEPTGVQDDIPSEYVRITPQEAAEMMTDEALFLDVRTQEEFDAGHIPDSVLLPHDEIRDKAGSMLPDKNQTILIYCRTGRRSELAARELLDMGYTGVFDFGGIVEWTGETTQSVTD